MGEKYQKVIAKITNTMLGYEDHGIFTAYLQVSYGGSGQAVGGYGFDEFNEATKCRDGTAFGCEFIQRIIEACGVRSWEEVEGRTIYVVKEGDQYFGKVVGIEPLPTEKGKAFMFDELRAKYFAVESEEA